MTQLPNIEAPSLSNKQIKEELLKSSEKSQVMLVYVCSFLCFSWAIFDYFVAPGLFNEFFKLRLLSLIVPSLLCFFRKELNLKVVNCLLITGITITSITAYMINVIPEHEFKTFSLAYIVFFVGVGMLALWEIQYSFILVSLTVLLNAVFYYFFSPIALPVYLIDGQFAVATVAIFSILLVNIRYKLNYSELSARMSLEFSNQTIQKQRDSLSLYANQMEQLVQERTAELSEKSTKIIEQKIFYETIFSNIPIEISIFDAEHRYLFANKMAIPDHETRTYILGKDDATYCKLSELDEEKTTKRHTLFMQSLQDKKPVDFEETFVISKDQNQYKKFGYFPIFTQQTLQFMIFYGSDITVKKKYELKIEDALKEKEALLGEVHHRVKNNLALITGLIEFQKMKITDEPALKEFDEIKHRISSMALIHETLYKSSNFAQVDLSQCIKDLIQGLKSFYGRSKDIKLHLEEMQSVLVPTKTAIPVALMVNEMITNSYKHAFTDTNSGEIKTQLRKIGNMLEIIISDNGKGMQTSIDPQQSKSLGMRLISIFVKQLKGNISFIHESGLTIKITAPVE